MLKTVDQLQVGTFPSSSGCSSLLLGATRAGRDCPMQSRKDRHGPNIILGLCCVSPSGKLRKNMYRSTGHQCAQPRGRWPQRVRQNHVTTLIQHQHMFSHLRVRPQKFVIKKTPSPLGDSKIASRMLRLSDPLHFMAIIPTQRNCDRHQRIADQLCRGNGQPPPRTHLVT